MKQKANVPGLIADFQRDNEAILEAMRLFEVSNAEYERALRALAPAPSTTASSSHDTQGADRDAILE